MHSDTKLTVKDATDVKHTCEFDVSATYIQWETSRTSYVGHDPLQAYSTQNGILMVLGGPKRYAVKMVFKWFWGVQKGMLKKWYLNGFGGSKKVCFKNGL